jgi:hypothetical protein
MRAHTPKLAFALLPVLALLGCQKPDVGARCVLSWNQNWELEGTSPPPTPLTAQGDYFESGNIGCDDLVCIVSPADAGSKYGGCSDDACGYCSKPCVSDGDCYKSDTGLACEKVVLDEAFLATLDEATKTRYLGEIRFSSYCVVPRQ